MLNESPLIFQTSLSRPSRSAHWSGCRPM